MPYKDRAKQRAFQLASNQRRRRAWLKANGPCACGSRRLLQVDHVDRKSKVDHKIWSWSEKRRVAELEKCQVLCEKCHIEKTRRENQKPLVHGILAGYSRGCRCDDCRRASTLYKRQNRAALKGDVIKGS